MLLTDYPSLQDDRVPGTRWSGRGQV